MWGLGGRTAEAVSKKLQTLSEKAQLVCVTHLPVVAAGAQTHFTVEKTTHSDSTQVKVCLLSQEERVEEIARMLAGGASQDQARELASRLLS